MTTHSVFYSEISKLRDLFHKYGKFDDANAKLDEISKYLSIYIYQLQHDIKENNFKELITKFEKDNTFDLTKIIQNSFQQIINTPDFLSEGNISIFGSNPSLNIDNSDSEFVYVLLKLVVNSIESSRSKNKVDYNFDLLNESFGNFVRDNFRNHIEDAQYMTPPEVVEFMCNIALFDLKKLREKKESADFVVCDPCCGVGSFLSTFFKKNKELKFVNESNLKVVGQDKVSRMVRMAKINLLLFNSHNHFLTSGNSLVGESGLTKWNSKVDLILTNPPFGAKFKSKELRINANNNYPLFKDLIQHGDQSFSSEVLFVDRCISLLKDGGKLLVVLPDSVISSAGMNAILRERLLNQKDILIRGIIELPAVTFAQAGTRTKTSILYIEKNNKTNKNAKVFIAQSESLGFQVNNKKGATIKYKEGENDLPLIYNSYVNVGNKNDSKQQTVLGQSPSAVLLDINSLQDNSWTASHYNAKKLLALNNFLNESQNIELVRLKDLADFESRKRKKENIINNNSKCISILHINDDSLNYEELLTYSPKYHGYECRPGDLLFSKINPRILRIFVVPDLGLNLTCSTEFEILNSKTSLSNYALKLLLMLPSVQIQIKYLTSGTSSSHNRIKSYDLGNVLIPLPKKNSKLYKDFLNNVRIYEKQNIVMNLTRMEMTKMKNEVFDLLV